MTGSSVQFGYYPLSLHLASGSIKVETLPDLDQTAADMEASNGIEKGWIYAPPRQRRDFVSGQIAALPYPSRIFGLPKTHTPTHDAANGADHLTFHIWCLSFFTGMRLTATEAGFVDATPLKPGALVDFVPGRIDLQKALELAERFWINNKVEPRRTRLVAATIHALFLAHNPVLLQFERFLLLSCALDACYALASSLHAPPPRLGYAKRILWMCELFGMAVPTWADPAAASGPEAALLRNETVHEALFVGEPLGFAVHGPGTNRNLPLEMEALICRLLVALLGAAGARYVTSPVNTRQYQALDLP
ncbi:MAG TPA: hypothetical protein VGB04_02400 [Allosphingosinicella sp.]|jgi:hypothetical protein